MMLRWSARARRDLKEIAKYIARDNPIAARRWIEKLRVRAQQAATMPRTGRIVPEIGRENIREVLQGSYRIVYQINQHGIDVVTVIEGHRLLQNVK
ncbi:MAG TPA: type II toxin-antitoxin system RelE/ParE family toxin [Polyangium sp.]|jgi:addiction module RelE/StbE family toxin|nr:type II toxin-antitoxin system RelE/ParE family toxin [Polyangium sp.]